MKIRFAAAAALVALLDGGDGRDTIDAGSGDDTIDARDNKRDTINCGSGEDTVVADPEDRLMHCEDVTRR
jgi:Ca2+-binding RTX toxin-like protein